MNFLKQKIFSLLLILTSQICETYSLDLDSVRNGPCITPKIDSTLNITRYATTDWRYFIAGSKYDLYQAASGHPNFDLIRESEFYYFACFELVKVKMGAESTVINSFGGKAQIKLTNPEINDIGDFEIDIKPLPRSGVKKQRIHHYITLTDSDKYVVNYNCFNGKIRGFTVLSTEALLDVGKMKRIDEHVITLGFRREDIIWLRRDACGKAEENQHCTKEGPTCSGK